MPDEQPAPAVTWQHPVDTGTDLSPARLGALTNRLAALDPASARREIARLKSNMAQSSVAERLKLAALLNREHNGMDELRQADTLLENLIPDLEDGDTRALARLLQHNIRLQLLLTEERNTVAELTRKIQQIKGLEEELQQHNSTTDPSQTLPAQ
ncbi:MAG: hypothetical protein HY941_13935 [Gammaproteobacteria bacterium]|nr:hypothetical protein [Gammaproteobacteria bacterium]